jgi:hypothetical protein
MIKSFEGEYKPVIQIESGIDSWVTRVRNRSADFSRFARSVANFKVASAYLVQTFIAYPLQITSDIM